MSRRGVGRQVGGGGDGRQGFGRKRSSKLTGEGGGGWRDRSSGLERNVDGRLGRVEH
jgi:hypothetical protein